MSGLRERAAEHTSSLVVTALSAAFGVALIQIVGALALIIASDDIGRRNSVQIALSLVAGVFIFISVYVGAVVTSNTFSTIIAGRTRTLALMRLVGATAHSLRKQVGQEGLLVGIGGALLGAIIGWLCAAVGLRLAVSAGSVPDLPYAPVDPLIGLPVVCVVLATWGASWVGSRRVLAVTPLQATGAAVEPTREEAVRRPVRYTIAGVLFFGGIGALAAGVTLGQDDMGGFLVAFAGGVASFSGVVAGAPVLLPPLLALVGKLWGRSPAATLATHNALRYPERSSRTAIGLVIGVTLVTTFSVAMQGYVDSLLKAQEGAPEMYAEMYEEANTVMTITVTVFSALIGFSAVIAAFGMINNLSLSVIQRTRELGLLRALGFTRGQIRWMIVAESAQMTVTAVGLGLILGVGYGWAGAQSLLGSISGSSGINAPTLPLPVLATVVIGAAVLTVAASVAPTRRATAVTPVVALSHM